MAKKIKWLCKHCGMTGTVDPSEIRIHFCPILNKYIWIKSQPDAVVKIVPL